MTSTGTYQGLLDETRKSSKVLKPPGGGSSDIFGSVPEDTSPRRVKNHNQSQLGSALFGDAPNNGAPTGSSNNGNSCTDSPRCNSKPGNDSHNRLFGPPDAPPVTPNAKNHMRSNISLSGESSSSSLSSGFMMPSAKSAGSTNPATAVLNGFAASNGNMISDITDGNPVTGTGYTSEPLKNGPSVQNGTSSSTNSSFGEKSNGSSPSAKAPSRTRVPPGGYSSGLW